MNNNIDISNESLEDASFAFSNLFDFPNDQLSESCFKKGANWQAKKDKAIIDKLTKALKETNIQLEYLNEKFGATGTSNLTISRNNTLINLSKETIS